MDNQNQPLSKKTFIKRLIFGVIGTIIFAAIVMLLGYGGIPVKPFLIASAIIVPLMIISAIVGYKYKQQILQIKSKLSYLYLILGLVIIIINGILIIIGERGINYYVQIGVGFILLFYGIKQMKKS